MFDGLLQLQPKMFGSGIVQNVFAPNLAGQPAFMQTIISFGVGLFRSNVVLANTLAAIVQLGIAILLLLPRKSKATIIGLWLTIVWGLTVWVFGEGAGNLLTGTASFYTGAPGSVLIYVFLAVMLLLPRHLPNVAYPKSAGVVLLLAAALQCLPLFWTADGISSLFQSSAADVLSVIRVPATQLTALSAGNPIAANILLILLPAVLGLALLISPDLFTGCAACAFLVLVWWFAQDIGGLSTVFTGTTTDPNTMPVLALFLLPILRNQTKRAPTTTDYLLSRDFPKLRIWHVH